MRKNESVREPVRRPTSAPGAQPQVASALKRRAATGSVAAIIGPSMAVKGSISGNEDLLIEGRVEGVIQIQECDVTVGSEGRVSADIHAKRIYVDGEVTGDLVGDEILIRRSGRVEGNAKAPKVALENGCRFRGSIDMNPQADAKKAGPVPRVSPDRPG